MIEVNNRWCKIILALLFLFGVFWLVHSLLHERPDLTIVGYTERSAGIGQLSVDFIDTLQDDCSINFLSTQKNCLDDLPTNVKNLLQNRIFQFGKVVLFGDSVWRPGYTPYTLLKTPVTQDQIRIAYSVFDSSAIPHEWAIILNSYFDAVAVSDPFLVNIYQKCGVKIPIFVLPPGLNLQPFLDLPLKKEPHTPFVFGNLGVSINRKNQLTLVRAFAKAFGNNDQVKLLINSRDCNDPTKDLITQEIERLHLTNVHYSVVTVDLASYRHLMEEIDCFVTLSKGEGFSIQPREALAMGIPVILSDNTGQSTLCKTPFVVSVPISGEEEAYYSWGGPFGHYYLSNENIAAAKMQDVYQNYAYYLSLAPDMRKWAEQYTYKNLKPLYKSLVKPKKVVLGKENLVTADCLYTNSEELYNKYLHL